jgi:hypothetical protein
MLKLHSSPTSHKARLGFGKGSPQFRGVQRRQDRMRSRPDHTLRTLRSRRVDSFFSFFTSQNLPALGDLCGLKNCFAIYGRPPSILLSCRTSEVWHRLPAARLRLRAKRCNLGDHFDSERVAGCPAAPCSLEEFVGNSRFHFGCDGSGGGETGESGTIRWKRSTSR